MTNEEKAILISSSIWLNVIDYVESNDVPYSPRFQIYLWNALCYSISDIIRSNHIEDDILYAFLKTACQNFNISPSNKEAVHCILDLRKYALYQFSRSIPSPDTDKSLLELHLGCLMLFALDNDADSPPIPTPQQETEFLLATASITRLASDLFPKASSSQEETKQQSTVYFVTSFDGHSLRIPEEKLDEFKKRDQALEEEYFTKYGFLRDALSATLVRMTKEFLLHHASSCNRESFLFIASSVLTVSFALADHYPTTKLIREDICTVTLSTEKDMFCLYNDKYSIEKQESQWVSSIRRKYNLNFASTLSENILENKRALKKFAKDVFLNSCPRSPYNRKAEQALISLMHDFNKSAISLISKVENT